MQHCFEFLWRTHSFHHSVDELWWFSGFRTSFLHSLLYNVPQAFVPLFLFQLTPLEAGLGFALGVLAQLWEHANVDVDLGPLRHVLVSPKYHRIHHAAIEPQNKNFAPIFALWDKLFGTYVEEDPAVPCTYGIIGQVHSHNPIRLTFHEWIAMFRDAARAGGWRAALGQLFGPPERALAHRGLAEHDPRQAGERA